MSVPPKNGSRSGLTTDAVTFTARGEAALDELTGRFAARCDGSVESIASLIEDVLDTDIEVLAAALRAPDEPTVPHARPTAATSTRRPPDSGAG